jgi:hypothetical protein
MDLETLKDTPPWEWPPDTEGILLGILSDRSAEASKRLLAAELAGDYTIINDQLASALLTIAQAPDEAQALRCQAATSLGPALGHTEIYGFEDTDDLLLSEEMFYEVQRSLHSLYADSDVPTKLRQRILEASVRAPQDWHRDAVREAYSREDEAWLLTAVFCMGYVRGFDDQILEALESDDPEIHYGAVCAAGNWGIDAAWRHIAELLSAEDTDKPLRLAAIDAVANIRPQEAGLVLDDLTDSEDEEIAEAAYEALVVAEGALMAEEDEEDEEGEPLR